MASSKTQSAETTLSRSRIHQEWIGNYRTSEKQRFYEMAFGFIVASFKAPLGATVLDAVCGNCLTSRILVDVGSRWLGSDHSGSASDPWLAFGNILIFRQPA